jgi:hypothetical protein
MCARLQQPNAGANDHVTNLLSDVTAAADINQAAICSWPTYLKL